ncbi:MAG: 50S ribosomal protein L13 [Verrucomicrobiota bacterium]
MKTFSAKAETTERQWWVIDATGRVVGDVAVQAARLLRGKNKPTFTPHVDTGDFVVIVNAEKAEFTGTKELNKVYFRHTGWVGGVRTETPASLREKHPERILEHAIKGMIPHNRLGRQIIKKLKVYPGAEHPHQAQNPQPARSAA